MRSQSSRIDETGSGVTVVGKRVRVYVGESDQSHGRPLYMALLEMLRTEGCAGATVIRGIAGFGANSRIHTASVLRLSEDLPVVIDWIDTPERVERLLPRVVAEVGGGLVTVEDLMIAHYSHRKVTDVPQRIAVGEVMTRDITSVRPEAPLSEAIDLLLARRLRALPVVDSAGRVVGMLTAGDLVERGGLGLRIELLHALPADAAARELRTSTVEKTVSDAMTRDPVTVTPAISVADAAHVMVQRRLKRLPVVDASGRLQGMVSRVDLLRTASESFAALLAEPSPLSGLTIGDVVRTDVPRLRRDAPLSDVLDAVVSTRLNRALVLDADGKVIGVVSDAELVRRLSPRDHPSVARALMTRLPFALLSAEERRAIERATGVTAEALMDPQVTVVAAEAPIAEATATMLRARRKVLPVVDAAGKLLGAVDRADLLRVLLAGDISGPGRAGKERSDDV